MGFINKETYSATSSRTTRVVVLTTAVLAVGIPASATEVVAGDFNRKVELGGSRGCVLEDGEPSGAVAVANTEVERGVVAPGVGV